MNSNKFDRSKADRTFLEDSGNVRNSSSLYCDKTNTAFNSRLTSSQRSNDSRLQTDRGVSDYVRLVDNRQTDTLLGYDWIAAMLDNAKSTRSLDDEEERLFERVKEFRQYNKHDCIGSSKILTESDSGQTGLTELHDPGHTCIHGYVVNERLFPEPVNVDMTGSSVCPVCLTSRTPPTGDCPGFVRVSIPRKMIESPYKIKPHRRNSLEDLDSFALSQHCQTGYKVTRPMTVKTAVNIDLKDALTGIKSPMTTLQSEEEARQIINQTMRKVPSTSTRRTYLPTTGIILPGVDHKTFHPTRDSMTQLS